MEKFVVRFIDRETKKLYDEEFFDEFGLYGARMRFLMRYELSCKRIKFILELRKYYGNGKQGRILTELS